MLAQLILVALAVLVDEAPARTIEAGIQGGRRKHHLRGSPFDAHAVELRKDARGKERRLHIVHARALEDHAASVGREIGGEIVRRMVRQAHRFTAAGGHDEDVEVAEAVGGESDHRSVARPDGTCFVRRLHGQRYRATARNRNHEEIAAVHEDGVRAVGGDRREAEPVR